MNGSENIDFRALFDRCMSIHEEIEYMETGSRECQLLIEEAVTKCLQLQQFVRVTHMFSPNESVDDVGTMDLRYLLVDALLGQFLIRKQLQHVGTTFTLNEKRVSQLQEASFYFTKFLDQCRDLDIPYDELSICQSEDPQETKVTSSASLREEKIKRFKCLKALEAQLHALQHGLSQTSHQRDEEDQRQYVLKMIQIFMIKSYEQLQLITEEEALLRQHLTSTHVNVQAEEPCATKTKPPLDRTFVLTNKEQLLSKVFKPSHRLPTMTIDEYLKREFERGNIITQEKKSSTKEDRELSDIEMNEDTYRTRSWDDYKDDNPRGWGNQMARRG